MHEFVDLASTVGVRVVYAHAPRFEPEDVEEIRRLVVADEEPGSDAARLLEEARGFIGRVTAIAVVFVHEGVPHVFWEEASWYADLQERSQELAEHVGPIKEAQEEARKSAWARRLAEDPRFQRTTNRPERYAVARRVLPELVPEWGDKPSATFEASLVADEAWRIFQGAIQPERELDLARKARELLDAGESKISVAGRLGISKDKLARILGRLAE